MTANFRVCRKAEHFCCASLTKDKADGTEVLDQVWMLLNGLGCCCLLVGVRVGGPLLSEGWG